MLIQKSIVGNFLMEEPHWFKMSYPYFWHPIKGMVKNGTIFMVVAVSAERYRAICHPLRKRQVRTKQINKLVIRIINSIGIVEDKQELTIQQVRDTNTQVRRITNSTSNG
jgi:hypothetical protein